MNRYHAHQELVKKTKIFIGRLFPKTVRLFDRHVGLFYIKRVAGGIVDYTPVKINKPGMADNWGVAKCYFNAYGGATLGPFAIHFEAEYKTGSAKMTPEQENWKTFCESMGIWHFVVRNEKELGVELEAKARSKNLILESVNYGIGN